MTAHHKPGSAAAARRTAAIAAALGGAMLVCLAALLAHHAEQASPLLGRLVSPRWSLTQLAGLPSDCLLCAPAAEDGGAGPDERPGLADGSASGAAARADAGSGASTPAPAPAPPGCSLNALLDRKRVRWSRVKGAADRLTVRGCPLRRYSAAEARQCLAGKRLVFVGDSVTRYLYLVLLHFLDKGEWPAPYGGVPGRPSVANEHEWRSWNDFLRGTSALFGGRELCDCFRKEYDPLLAQLGFKPSEEEKFENRFYSRPTPAGNLSVVHLTYTTYPNKLHGHWGFPPHSGLRRPCAPAKCSAPADWAHHLPMTFKGPVRELAPTHLILNTGLWGPASQVPDWEAIARAGRRAVEAQGGRVIWRTTTATMPTKRRQPGGPRPKPSIEPGHDEAALAALLPAGWEVMDAFALTRPLTRMRPAPLWDGRHFQAVVYRELNLYLLNLICEQEEGSGSSGRSSSGSGGGGGGAAAAAAALGRDAGAGGGAEH